jgi:putative FmdB family regulatory protein
MPIFEFVCGNCGEEFEKLVRSGSAEIRCLHCASEDVERVLSTFRASTSSRGRSTATVGTGSGCGSCSSGSCGTCGR